MSDILQLIRDNSFEAIHILLRGCHNRISNAKDENNVSALSLATKTLPPLEAVRLIDALIVAGANLQKRDDEKRNVLLFACKAGVDPIIFCAILNWNPRRKNNLVGWWEHFDSSYNGAFVLACNSGNFDLAEHVLNVALTTVSPTSFLNGEPNNILKALLFAVEAFDESAALKVMKMYHKVIDKIPGGYFRSQDRFD